MLKITNKICLVFFLKIVEKKKILWYNIKELNFMEVHNHGI